MIDFSPLFKISFWFDLQPNSLSPAFEKTFFLGFALLIVGGAIMRIIAKQNKKNRFQKKIKLMYGNMLLWMGIVGLSWFVFTYEEAYLLGARFWFLIWIIGFAVWFGYILRFAKHTIEVLQTKEKNKVEQNKYLPRKKRK